MPDSPRAEPSSGEEDATRATPPPPPPVEPALAEPIMSSPIETAPVTTSELEAEAQVTRGGRGGTRFRVPRVVVVGLVAVLFVVGILVFALGGPTSSLVVEVDPPVHFEVYVDGEGVRDGAPLEGLSKGLHMVEVRAEGFQPYRQQIRIGPGRAHTMRVRLRPVFSP